MFTGIVEEVGVVTAVQPRGAVRVLRVRAGKTLEDTSVGDSICVSGVCLTVTSVSDLPARRPPNGMTPVGGDFSVDVSQETLVRTTLALVRTGDKVNLERALQPGGRLGGHFVQGHVDCTGRVVRLLRGGETGELEVSIPAEYAQYVAAKGSIAVDGISLTVVRASDQSFTCAIIPYTLENTTLGDRRAGDLVNIETDILAKYVARTLKTERPRAVGAITDEYLRELGY